MNIKEMWQFAKKEFQQQWLLKRKEIDKKILMNLEKWGNKK